MKIQVKRGLKQDFLANQPTIEAGEFVFFTDTNELFMGSGFENDTLIPITTEKLLNLAYGQFSTTLYYDIYNEEITDYGDGDVVRDNLGSFLYSLLTQNTVISIDVPASTNGPAFLINSTDPGFSIEYIFEPSSARTQQGGIESINIGFIFNYTKTINSLVVAASGQFSVKVFKTLANAWGVAGPGQNIEDYTNITTGDVANELKFPNVVALNNFTMYAYIDGDDYAYDGSTEVEVHIQFNEVRENDFLRNKELESFDKIIDIYMPSLRVTHSSINAPSLNSENFTNYDEPKNAVVYSNSDDTFWSPKNVFQKMRVLKGQFNGYSFYGDEDTGLFSILNPNLSDFNTVILRAGGTEAISASGTSSDSAATRVRRDIYIGSGYTIKGNITPNLFTRSGSFPSITATNMINQNSSTHFGGGGTLAFNTATNATLTIPPYYKTASQVVNNQSEDLQFNLGGNQHVCRLGSGTVTVAAGANIVNGANTYRTRFAIEGQTGLATSFQIPLYGKVTLTLVQGNATGVDHIWLVEGNVTNVVLA
jgi:hypothetical protein